MALHEVGHLRNVGEVAIFLPGRKRSMEQLREALDSFRKANQLASEKCFPCPEAMPRTSRLGGRYR
jgi:hypothetical protein